MLISLEKAKKYLQSGKVTNITTRDWTAKTYSGVAEITIDNNGKEEHHTVLLEHGSYELGKLEFCEEVAEPVQSKQCNWPADGVRLECSEYGHGKNCKCEK